MSLTYRWFVLVGFTGNTERQVFTAAKTRKQEAHGPHRSPEKTVQINKHMII